jgi:hypothetical protein
MNINEINLVLENLSDTQNKKLLETKEILSVEFENTKKTLIELSRHLDVIYDYFYKVENELDKRGVR